MSRDDDESSTAEYRKTNKAKAQRNNALIESNKSVGEGNEPRSYSQYSFEPFGKVSFIMSDGR